MSLHLVHYERDDRLGFPSWRLAAHCWIWVANRAVRPASPTPAVRFIGPPDALSTNGNRRLLAPIHHATRCPPLDAGYITTCHFRSPHICAGTDAVRVREREGERGRERERGRQAHAHTTHCASKHDEGGGDVISRRLPAAWPSWPLRALLSPGRRGGRIPTTSPLPPCRDSLVKLVLRVAPQAPPQALGGSGRVFWERVR